MGTLHSYAVIIDCFDPLQSSRLDVKLTPSFCRILTLNEVIGDPPSLVMIQDILTKDPSIFVSGAFGTIGF